MLMDPKERERFREAVETEVVSTGGGLVIGPIPNPPMASNVLSLARDRILLDLSESRFAIRREYPSKEELDRLAEVTGLAIRHTTAPIAGLQALGYNLIIVYDIIGEKASFQYLGERLFSESLPVLSGWNLLGGSARLIYSDAAGSSWTFSIEPRFGDLATKRVYLNVNRHFEHPEMPSTGGLCKALGELWDTVHQYVIDFDAVTCDGRV